MHRGYPADVRLCRLARSLVAALTSPYGRRAFMPGLLCLPRLNPSCRVSCTNPCTNLVAALRVLAYQAAEMARPGSGWNARAAPDRRLVTAHARYAATVDLGVECPCRSLKLDAVTVSQRLKSYDLDGVATDVEALSQPGSGRFGPGLRIENSCPAMTQCRREIYPTRRASQRARLAQSEYQR